MLEFPQPAITKSRTAEAGANSRRARRGKPTRIGPSYNPVRLSGRAKAKCYFRSPVLAVREQVCLEQVLAVRLLLRRPCRGKLMARLLIALGSPSTSKQLRRSRNYFFLRSFFDSPFDSLASVVARLDSPGRYSSCSAAAKAFSNPTMSSPGRSVSNDSTSLRSCSSE